MFKTYSLLGNVSSAFFLVKKIFAHVGPTVFLRTKMHKSHTFSPNLPTRNPRGSHWSFLSGYLRKLYQEDMVHLHCQTIIFPPYDDFYLLFHLPFLLFIKKSAFSVFFTQNLLFLLFSALSVLYWWVLNNGFVKGRKNWQMNNF